MSKRCLNDVLYGANVSKRAKNPLYSIKQEFAQLLGQKREFLNAQRRASLLVPPFNTDSFGIQKRFAELFEKLNSISSAGTKDSTEYKNLAAQLIQESLVMEWPKTIYLDGSEGNLETSIIEADCSPLIHRARNVVKCRTSHPTMRIKICAIDDQHESPVTEAVFRATLVKLANESNELRPVAGRLILTQREGTPSVKNHEKFGVSLTSDGRLLVYQYSEKETSESVRQSGFVEKFGEVSRSVQLQFHNGVLCATFPEIGVMLNSMIDRRQLNTRYAIQVEVALRLQDQTMVEQSLISHPFLIAITNDQTEPLLLSIFWQRLLSEQQIDYSTNQESDEVIAVRWDVLKQAIKYFVKAQISNGRCLCDFELLHIQCMIFLMRAANENPTVIEEQLFGNVHFSSDANENPLLSLRNRLLSEHVKDDVTIQRHEFMRDKCMSVVDSTTLLDHSVWHWLFKVTEMVVDIGHKLCPSANYAEKKTNKKPFSLEACTMLNLFNQRVITVMSVKQAAELFKDLTNETHSRLSNKALLLRFCDENLGCLSLMASHLERPSTPYSGCLSSEKITREVKQGLAEILMESSFLARQYDRIVKIDELPQEPTFTLLKKSHVFPHYQNKRVRKEGKHIANPFIIRVDPLSGECLDHMEEQPPSTSSVDTTLLGSLPNLTPVDFTAIHSSANSTPHTSITPEPNNLVNILQPPFLNAHVDGINALLIQNLATMLQNPNENIVANILGMANNSTMQNAAMIPMPKAFNEMMLMGILSNQLTNNVANLVNHNEEELNLPTKNNKEKRSKK